MGDVNTMINKEVLELKRRFKKEACTFTRMCGCYVDSEKNKVTDLAETFLNLEDEEFYKYLEIAKKTLSGKLGNNLLQLDFPLEEEGTGGRQQFLMGLRDSKLKNEDLLERFYEMVIENYDYAGHYLILIFHDAYDVMTRTTDQNNLDESEEVFEYLLCAICPVQLSKPGLGYREDENRIGPRIRDWVVSAPDSGFLFPAFNDRSTDIHSLLFYTKDAKAPHVEFMESGLGCTSKRTATEQKNVFHSIIKSAYGEDSEEAETKLLEVQGILNEMVEDHEAVSEEGDAPLVLSTEAVMKAVEDSGIPEEKAHKIEQAYNEKFADEPPVAEHVIDEKALEQNEQKKEKEELRQQVEVLQQELEDRKLIAGEEDSDETDSVKTYDVILRVKPEKLSQIKSETIHGQKCLVIPMAEDEHANVNGVNTVV